LFIIVGVFIYTNQITHDALSERYLIQKEEETGEGENKLLNEYTTGRWEIFLIDLKIWQAHPVFGQGVGISKFQHPNQAAAHIEFSRLLAEHGFLGLVLAVGLFIWLPLKEIKKRTTNQERIWTLALFLLSILSTFHAATRTLVPVILYGAAYLNINAIQHTEDT
jgi:O-antigen ligase